MLISFFIIIFGFVVSALGGYLAGLVGASNSPLSAIVIMSIISVATMIVVVVGGDIAGTDPSTNRLLSASALTILVTAVMANTATLAIDNLQDLKSGQIVGATPWKQQVMLIGGVLVSALFISKILEILYSAYGFEGAMPRPDMNPENALAAPTASVMNKITSAVFSGSMNWQMFSIGVGIAFLFIIGEIWCKKTNRAYKMSPLAFSLGVYLPMHVAFPMFFGGLMGYLADRRLSKRRSQVGAGFEARADAARKRGLLFSSGLIAGEALIGIALAIPFAASQNTKLFDLRPENFDSIANFLGAGAFVAVALYLRHVSGTIRPLKET